MITHDGPRAARHLATGVMGPASSTPFLGPSSAEKSRFEKYRPNVKIETSPDERRFLNAAHLASIALRRTFDHWVTVGRALQLLRQKADQLGTRNAFTFIKWFLDRRIAYKQILTHE